MAIEVTCVCGNRLKGKPQWAGSQAKCPYCGSVVTFPNQTADPFARPGGVGDLLDEELASSVTKPAVRPPATQQPEVGRPAKQPGFFARLWKKLSMYGTIAFRWQEPTMYRMRLRGDIPLRVIIAMSVWAAASGAMLVVIGFNKNPDHPLAAAFLGAVFGLGPAVLLLFRGREQVSGQVTVAEREVHRNRHYASIFFGRGWYEWSKWPYGAIHRVTILPAEALDRSFSVAIIDVGGKSEIVGIPKKINVKEFAGHMAAQGVQVEQGQAVPAAFTRPIRAPVVAAWAFFGAVCFLSGLSVYVQRVGGLAPRVAKAPDAQRARMQEIREKGPQGMPPGIRFGDMPDARNAPGDAHGMVPGARQKPDGDAEPNPGIPKHQIKPQWPAFRDPADDPADSPAESPFPDVFPRGGMFPRQDAERATTPAAPSMPPIVNREPPSHHIVSAPVAPLQPGDTALAGGSGGGPFRETSPDGRPVLGFRYSLGSWAGQPALRSLDPLFERTLPPGRSEHVLARQGYAVAGLNVRTSQFVSGVQVVFMAVSAGGKLDPADSYASDWIGEAAGGETTNLGGTGAKVIGVHGRRAAVLDAVGLVTEPR